MNVSTNLLNNFDNFKNNGEFIDCELLVGEGSIKCHKIVLANYSSYFKNLFEKEQTKKSIYSINILFNPKGMMKDMIDFLYTRSTFISDENIVALLAISFHYKFDFFYNVLNKEFDKLVRDSTILKFVSELEEYQMYDKMKEIVSFLSQLFISQKVYTRKEIYENLGPIAFSALLNMEVMKIITDDEKIQCIDDYSMYKKIENSEKHWFDSVVDWEKEDSYSFILKYKCDWLSPKIAVKLYSRAISERRKAINGFKKNVEETKNKNISKWCAFSFFNQVGTDPQKSFTKPVDLIDFFSTLGGTTPRFDPLKYELISVDSSPTFGGKNLKTDYFSAANAIIPNDLYFIGVSDGKRKPWICVDFGKCANIIFTDIGTDSNIPRGKDMVHIKPESLSLLVGNDSKALETFDPKDAKPSRYAYIELGSNGSSGINKLRIKRLCIKGYFAL